MLPAGEEYLHKVFPYPGISEGMRKKILAAYRDVRYRIAAWIGEQFGPG